MNMITADSSLSNYRRKPRVLFVAQDNSSHTQMAEGYLRSLGENLIHAQSAGMESKPIDQRVIAVMDEDGVNIRHQQSNLISADLLTWADLVVTLGEDSSTLHVAVPNSAHHKHWAVHPPTDLADREQALQEFRECRNEVKRRVQGMMNAIRLFRGR
jgi:arsenate reductase